MNRKLLVRLVALVAFLLPMSVTSQINSFPYTEDFETFGTCGTSCASACAMSNGWTNTGTTDWRGDVGGTGSSNTGPSVDHSPGTSSGIYLYTETSGCYGDQTELVSPPIDLTGTNNIQFTFWYHQYGANMGTAHVDVTTDAGTTWINDVIPAFTDNQDLWQQKVIALGTYTGTVQVRVRYEGWTSFGADMALDDFLIFDLLQNDIGVTAFTNPLVPTCSFNDSVAVDLTNFGTDTLTTATINWSWNSVPQTPFSWTGSLAPGASMNQYLGSVMYTTGDDLSAWTSLPNGLVEMPSGNGNDTTSLINLQTGLSGIKTIGGTTPDYIDFASAMADLNIYGVCGPVIFDVRDGVYPEQLTLTNLPSMDSTKTITFRGESGDPALATIDFVTVNGSNYVVSFDNAPHFRFENLTIKSSGASYTRVLDFNGGNYDINIEGCILEAPTSTTTSNFKAVIHSPNGSDDNGIHFLNNTVIGGSYAAYFYGSSNALRETGNVFEGNNFHSNYYRGVHIYYNDGLKMNNNLFDGSTSYTSSRYAMYLYYTGGSPEVTGNTVTGDATSGWGYGMYMYQGGGNNANHAVVNNNMITVGWPSYTGTVYGLYLNNSGYVDVYHNTVLAVSGGTSTRSFYATSGGEIEVKNNIFANYTGGYSMYVASTFSVTNSDYNVLYSPSGNTGYFGGNQATLADWQNASSFDANSINYNPNFYSAFDLHVCSDSIGNQGTPIATITMDVDGQSRDAANPDMGADEFNGISGSFLGNDVALCTGDSLQLFAGAPSDTVLWSTGASTSTIWVSTPGSYTVSVQSACGTGTDVIVVTNSAVNYAGYVAASDITFCNGDSVLLYSTQAADSYTWTGGSTNDSLYVTAGGTYNLDITDNCGSGSEAITVSMNDVPNANYLLNTSYFTASFTDASGAGAGATYAWNFGDGGTATSQNPIHIYANSGMYLAELTVTNDCGSMTFTDTVNIALAGIDELFANGEVNVYPNPSNGEFTIDMEVLAASNVSIRVENMLGAIVHETTPTVVEGVYSETISLGNVEAGIYFVEVIAGSNKVVKKLVIE